MKYLSPDSLFQDTRTSVCSPVRLHDVSKHVNGLLGRLQQLSCVACVACKVGQVQEQRTGGIVVPDDPLRLFCEDVGSVAAGEIPGSRRVPAEIQTLH